jgi:hypothetical protein
MKGRAEPGLFDVRIFDVRIFDVRISVRTKWRDGST